MRRTSLGFLILVAGTASALVSATKPAQAAEALNCEKLAGIAIANTTITTAESVAAGAYKPPGPEFPGQSGNYARLPAFCRIAGSIRPTANSDIRFELWLPASNWNGKFMQTGNGGSAGSIVYSSLADPLQRGYAVANTDTGHQVGGSDFAWGTQYPEKLTDFAYRAVHELTVTGKALTAKRYGRAPDKSYWLGCSTGGRQGLKEAQRYPEDYDGIVAGAPASNWMALMGLSIVIQRNLGPGALGMDKLSLLKEAAIAACDADDGVKDRVIGRPAQCKFTPASLQCRDGQTTQCLSNTEVAAAERIYRGVVSGNVTRMPGTGPGSEALWAAYASPGFSIGTNFYRQLVIKQPEWTPAMFNADTDVDKAEALDRGAIVAMDPDLSAFFKRGGKLITYHGSTDGLISYGNSVNYYQNVVAKLGEQMTREHMRFYLVNSMEHCSGGEGASQIDWLTPMEQWVEQGKAPATLLGTHQPPPPGIPGTPAAPGKPFTRPVCVYPEVTRYNNQGDVNDAASFSCVRE